MYPQTQSYLTLPPPRDTLTTRTGFIYKKNYSKHPVQKIKLKPRQTQYQLGKNKNQLISFSPNCSYTDIVINLHPLQQPSANKHSAQNTDIQLPGESQDDPDRNKVGTALPTPPKPNGRAQFTSVSGKTQDDHDRNKIGTALPAPPKPGGTAQFNSVRGKTQSHDRPNQKSTTRTSDTAQQQKAQLISDRYKVSNPPATYSHKKHAYELPITNNFNLVNNHNSGRTKINSLVSIFQQPAYAQPAPPASVTRPSLSNTSLPSGTAPTTRHDDLVKAQPPTVRRVFSPPQAHHDAAPSNQADHRTGPSSQDRAARVFKVLGQKVHGSPTLHCPHASALPTKANVNTNINNHIETDPLEALYNKLLIISQTLPSTPTVFRVFQVRNQRQGNPGPQEPNSHKTAEHPPSPRDPRIDYESRDLARRARRLTTEDPLEAKLREIFRSPERASTVTLHYTTKQIFNPNEFVHTSLQVMSQRQDPEPMEGEPQAKTARGDISTKYAQKSDAFRAKKNPEATKPRDKEEDFEIKDLRRKVYTASSYKLPAPKPYIDQPTITLRSLMPGDSKDADPEDRRLDMSFKAEKVEFLLVARPITEREIKEGCILESVNQSPWDIPEAEDFEDAMGKATNMLCTGNKHLIHQVFPKTLTHPNIKLHKDHCNPKIVIPQVSWSSVASQTGIGAFSMRTDNMEAMETLRGAIRSLVFGSSCFESFPKDALVKKFGLSIFFPRACAHVDEDLLIEWLRSCNPGLKGTIETIECREYKKSHPVVRRRGAKIITFTGDEEFLDSLHSFPSNFPFSIKIANAYIRGGDRVKERYAGGKSQRPKISQGALRDLLKRNSNQLADAAAEAEDRLADDLRRTDLQGKPASYYTNKLTLTYHFLQQVAVTNPVNSIEAGRNNQIFMYLPVFSNPTPWHTRESLTLETTPEMVQRAPGVNHSPRRHNFNHYFLINPFTVKSNVRCFYYFNIIVHHFDTIPRYFFQEN